MTDSFYVFADCQSLSGGCLGNKFETQSDMEACLKSKSRFRNEGSNDLPLYEEDMDMDMDQLYKTELSQNEFCCWYYMTSSPD